MHQYPSPTTIFVVSALEIEISCHDVSVSPNLVRVCFVVCATVRMMLERRNGFMIKDTCLCLMHLTFLYIYFFFFKNIWWTQQWISRLLYSGTRR